MRRKSDLGVVDFEGDADVPSAMEDFRRGEFGGFALLLRLGLFETDQTPAPIGNVFHYP